MENNVWRRGSTSTEAPLLLVDDEPTILETLTSQLGGDYRTMTAPDGDAALETLAREGPFAVVLSDLRLPGMDGVELLGRVRAAFPDATRLLYTAHADVEIAISAINEGQVFRFISKPCPTRVLRQTIRDAVERYRLVLAEREVLHTTLRGSMQALFGCLELASPRAYARAGRIRTLVVALCRELALDNVWEVEIAAMASQLGAITLPPAVAERLDRGLALSHDDQKMIDVLPDIAIRLLKDVPLLDDVVDIMRGLQPGRPDDRPTRAHDPAVVATGISILRAAIEFESLTSRTVSAAGAIAILERQGGHDPDVLEALRKVRSVAAGAVRALRLGELQVGMVVAEDVIADNGAVLIARGMIVTELLLDRLANYRYKAQIDEPITVLISTPGG